MPRKSQSLAEKVTKYNFSIPDTNKNHRNLTCSQGDSGAVVSGPLRVYWGIENPIQLKLFDEQSLKKTNHNAWRHSCLPANTSVPSPEWPTKRKVSLGALALPNIDEASSINTSMSSSIRSRISDDSTANTPTLRSRVTDDSEMSMSSIDTSGVVMRKTVKKSNTVSYRGDTGGGRWKRASINGHVYNNDTRVFIPVMGSCTSVMATDKMTTYDVIRALLDKFKIENNPEEFSLYIVPDKGVERLLLTSHSPLLERLELGPDEARGKLFLKETPIPGVPREAWNTLTPEPTPSIVVTAEPGNKFETPVEKYVEHLPDEVEQLIALPEALLQGVLKKFIKDEEIHIKMVQRKYTRLKNMMTALLSRQESFV